jgi:hypothetical protein
LARPGETPTPQIQQGAELPYGAATAANDASAGISADTQSAAPPDVGNPDPTLATATGSFLFGPTARPHEPITTGAPFGAGPDITPASFENNDAFMARVAQTFAADPQAPPEVKAFAALVESGQ